MAKKEKQRAGSLAGPSNAAGGNGGGGEGEVADRRAETSQPAQQRARVTVVCGECKRLKLKCDRRTPCGACVKRDTTDKCIYASGASEKIDAQFVLNKHTALEQEVEVLKGILQGQQAQISSLQSQLATQQGMSSSQISYEFLYQRQTGSSIMMSFDEMYGMWAEQGIDFRPKTPPAATTIALEHEERRDLVNARKRNLSLFEIPPTPIQSRSSSSSSNSSSSRQSAASAANSSGSIGVTTNLVDTLPSEPLRSQIISSLQTTLLLHPTVNFTEFKLRIDGLFRWSEEQTLAKQFNAHFNDPGRKRPSLSLFAAVAAAFALGAQCLTSSSNSNGSPLSSLSSSSSTPLTPPSPVHEKRKPRDLFVLSAQAVQLHTDAGFQSYDPDIVHALLLQIIYLLHTPANPTGPRRGLELPHELFPIIGSLVNVAKMLGLSRDPDEAPSIVDIGGVSGVAEGKRPMAYSPFVANERRKLWWSVMYYDLFLSDFMGHKPLICGDFTTRQPADVDDFRFNVSSTSLPPPTPESNLQFFLKRCELLLLVQSMKSRYVRDIETGEFSIDEASTFENHVQQILDSLPSRLKVDVDLNHSNTAPLPSTMLPAPSEPAPMASLQSSPPDAVRQPSSSKSSDRSTPGTSSPDGYVLAQACELSSIANRIKLKLNLPFLKPKLSEAGVPVPVPRQAILGALNAVHNITHASRLLHSTFRLTRPATLMYYSYSWTLFTAAIVSAHTIIHGQQDHFTSRAMEDVQAALFILRDSSVPTGKDDNGRNATSEAVRIPEAMKAKADAKLNPQKRKTREGEEGAAGSSVGPAAKIQALEASVGEGSGSGSGAMEGMQHLPSQSPELEMAYRMPSESLATPIDGVLPPHFHQQPQQFQQPTHWTGLMGLPTMPHAVDASGMPKSTKEDAANAAKDAKNVHGKPRVGFRNRNAPSKKEGSAPSSPTASTSQSPAASASVSASGSGSGSGSGSAATVGKGASSRKRNLVVRDRTAPRQNSTTQAIPQRATNRQQQQQHQQHSEQQHSQPHHQAQHVPSQASHHGGQPLHINTSQIQPMYHNVDDPSTPTPTLPYGQSPMTYGPSSGHPLSGHALDGQPSAGGQDSYQRASSTFDQSQPQLQSHPQFVHESNAYGVRYGSQQPQPQPQQQSYNGYAHTMTPSATTPQHHFPSMAPQHPMSHSHHGAFAHSPAPHASEQPSTANFASSASHTGQMVQNYWDQQQQQQYATGAMGNQALLGTSSNGTLQHGSLNIADPSYVPSSADDFSRSFNMPIENPQQTSDVAMGDQSRWDRSYGSEWDNPYPLPR